MSLTKFNLNSVTMNNSIEKIITSKWKVILEEYEKIKRKDSTIFTKVQELCEVHKVSRKQILKYYRRWILYGKDNDHLLPNKRGPKKGAHKLLTKEQERIIVKIQRKFESKPMDIWSIINIKENIISGVHPSAKTIARTLKRYSLNKKKKIIHRYEKNIPGELVHTDSFYIPKEVFKDGVQRYLQGTLDDCTRLAYVDMIRKVNAVESGKLLIKAGTWFNLHGFEIEKNMTDNGIEFTFIKSGNKTKAISNHFYETLLGCIGIKHIYTKIGRPQTNGKIERFWRILREEFLPGLKDLQEDEFIEKLQKFMYYYNYARLHSALGYKTPFEKLKFVTETLG